MTSTFPLSFSLAFNCDTRVILVSLLLLSSLVYAEANRSLDLTLDFDQEYIDDTMERDDWREPEAKQEINWREPQPVQENKNYRFGAKSIYEENPDREPMIPGVNRPSTPLGNREAAPDFQLRF